MANFIFGFIIAFIFSDAIEERFPSTRQFKIPLKTLQNLFPPIETSKLK